jgi:hypothetical protein
MAPMRFLLLFVLLTSISGKNPEKISYRHEPAFSAAKLDTSFEIVDFKDTIPNDTLFILKNENGLVHSYFRNVVTGVCIDGECRMLDITVYWAVTGRYLGFDIPAGEFLSKTEHVPFKKKDYDHLHKLLADPYSGLANYRIEELVPFVNEEGVDGVTAATIAGVQDYIVEDAVYTTYTLWHIVHGDTKNQLRAYTAQHLDANLLMKILNSPNNSDLIWGLESIPPGFVWTDTLQNKLFGLIGSSELIVANKAVESILPELLENEQAQLKLYFQFEQADYFVQRKLLKKLEEAPFLSPVIELKLAEKLPSLNGSMIKSVLDLFTVQQINNEKSEAIIAGLLSHENNFIARKAFQFLENHPTDNKKTEKLLRKYESRFN